MPPTSLLVLALLAVTHAHESPRASSGSWSVAAWQTAPAPGARELLAEPEGVEEEEEADPEGLSQIEGDFDLQKSNGTKTPAQREAEEKEAAAAAEFERAATAQAAALSANALKLATAKAEKENRLQYEECTQSLLPAAETSVASADEQNRNCATKLTQVLDDLTDKQLAANAKQELTKKLLHELRKTATDEKEARQVAFNAVKDRHDEQKACAGRLYLARQSQNSELEAFQNRVRIAEDKLKSKEAEKMEDLRKEAVSEAAKVANEVAGQEAAAEKEAAEAEVAAKQRAEEAILEAEQEMELNADDATAQDEVAVQQGTYSAEEKLAAVREERDQQVLAATQEIIDLRARVSEVKMKISTAEHETETSKMRRAKAESEERRYRDWYNEHGVNLKAAKIALSAAHERATSSLGTKKKIAKRIVTAVDPEYTAATTSLTKDGKPAANEDDDEHEEEEPDVAYVMT
eukprot:TRINITY_DN1058_c0_g1_i1.p1 TRINITY_DN1058_c0_g1~~TRINITY_DN1058_c0_g1_i1.p1  ORF type:complete len:464 (-),score=159.56 TRINITY_DN1058_c0_g1_i1:308-1699(-)